MTREEAKNWLNKLYARSDITDEYGDMEDMQPYEEAVNMAIKALEQEPKWIPVSERLPEAGQRVLITYNHEDELKVDITYFFSKYEDKYGFLLATPIAWMPLPEPYKEVEE